MSTTFAKATVDLRTLSFMDGDLLPKVRES